MNHFLIKHPNDLAQAIEITTTTLDGQVCKEDVVNTFRGIIYEHPYEDSFPLQWLSLSELFKSLESAIPGLNISARHSASLRQQFKTTFTYTNNTSYLHRLELQIIKTEDDLGASQVSTLDFKAEINEATQLKTSALIETATPIHQWLSAQNITNLDSSNVLLRPLHFFHADCIETNEEIAEVFDENDIVSTFATFSDGEMNDHVGLGFATMYIRSNTDNVYVPNVETQFITYHHGETEFTARIIKHSTDYLPILTKENTPELAELFNGYLRDELSFTPAITHHDALIKIANEQYNCITTVCDENNIMEDYGTYFDVYIDNQSKIIRFLMSEPCRGLAHFEFFYTDSLSRLHVEAMEAFQATGQFDNYTYETKLEIDAPVITLSDGNTIIFHVIDSDIETLALEAIRKTDKKNWTPASLCEFLKQFGVFACSSAEQISAIDGDMWTNSHACYNQNQKLMFCIEVATNYGYTDEYETLMTELNKNLVGGRHLGRVREFDIHWSYSDNFTTYLKPEPFQSQTTANHLVMLVTIENPSPRSILKISEVDQTIMTALAQYCEFDPNLLRLAGPTLMPISTLPIIEQCIKDLNIQSAQETNKIANLTDHIQRKIGQALTIGKIEPTDPALLFIPIITDIHKGELVDFIIDINVARGGMIDFKRITDIVPETTLKDFANSIGGGTITDAVLIHPDFIGQEQTSQTF
ncbi:hypothetical protein ACP3V3_16765 [Vibrio sp. PNB22_3_1]